MKWWVLFKHPSWMNVYAAEIFFTCFSGSDQFWPSKHIPFKSAFQCKYCIFQKRPCLVHKINLKVVLVCTCILFSANELKKLFALSFQVIPLDFMANIILDEPRAGEGGMQFGLIGLLNHHWWPWSCMNRARVKTSRAKPWVNHKGECEVLICLYSS